MYCFPVNLTVNPMTFELDLPERCPFQRKTNYVESFSVEQINPILLEILHQRDIRVGWVEIFHKYEGLGHWAQIHTDEHIGDFVKLNWVYGGSDSYMCWFKEKPGLSKTVAYNEIAKPYLSYDVSEVELVFKTPMQGLWVIQAGVPHNVYMGRQHRHALSMVLLDRRSTEVKRLTMIQAHERLLDLIPKT